MCATLMFPCSFQCVVCDEHLKLKTRRKTVKCHYCDEAYVTLISCPNEHFACPTCNELREDGLEENAVREKHRTQKASKYVGDYGLSELEGTPCLICYRRSSDIRKIYDQFMEEAREYVKEVILEDIKGDPKLSPCDKECVTEGFKNLLKKVTHT